jgi:hypothetical protein
LPNRLSSAILDMALVCDSPTPNDTTHGAIKREPILLRHCNQTLRNNASGDRITTGLVVMGREQKRVG